MINRFLSNEKLTSIDYFFGDRAEGLSGDVFAGRAEKLSA